MKFYGKVGFMETTETSPGVYEEQITERNYYGDVMRVSRRYSSSSEKVNDDLDINNEISIVADAYAYQNFHALRYIEWMGAKWKVSSVTVERPRLILSVGGVYNGPQT